MYIIIYKSTFWVKSMEHSKLIWPTSCSDPAGTLSGDVNVKHDVTKEPSVARDPPASPICA